MSKYSIEDTTLTAIGDALRAKEKSEDPIPVVDIASRIEALSIGTEAKFLTPEEVYEQYRPTDWPILPDPEANECYFLVKPVSVKTTSIVAPIPPTQSSSGTNATAEPLEIGYIDETGQFVSVYEMNRPSSAYWSHTSVADSVAKRPEMENYIVLKTTGTHNPTNSAVNTSTNATTNNTYSSYVLEVKVNLPNTRYFFGAKDSYPAEFCNLQFILFYNTSFYKDVKINFSGKTSLKTVVFKNYNPITDPNFVCTTTSNFDQLYLNCYSLLACYPLRAAAKYTSAFSGLYSVPRLEVDLSETTGYTGTLGQIFNGSYYNLKRLYLDFGDVAVVPYNVWGASSSVFNGGAPAIVIEKLKTSAGSAKLTGIPVDVREMLDIDATFSVTSGLNSGSLKRIFMSPTMTRSLGTLAFRSFQMTPEDLQEWFESLPEVSETATINISSVYGLYGQDVDNIITIATDKGYTVTR